MKYISNFDTTAEFEAAESTLSMPNVSLTKDDMQVHYKSYLPNETLFWRSITISGINYDVAVNSEGKVACGYYNTSDAPNTNQEIINNCDCLFYIESNDRILANMGSSTNFYNVAELAAWGTVVVEGSCGYDEGDLNVDGTHYIATRVSPTSYEISPTISDYSE